MRAEKQIETLANFIMAEIPGEPSQNEGAVECAIRIIRNLQQELQDLHNWRQDYLNRIEQLEGR